MEGEINMRKSGINSTTPQDMLLGAGTVFKNLKYVYSKVEVAEGADAPEGALQVVDDKTEETDYQLDRALDIVHAISLSQQQK